MTELNDVFEEDSNEETTEVTEKVETEETEDKAEEGEEKVEEVSNETEETASTEPKMVPLAALQDERRKRQERDRELEDLRSRLPKSSDEPDMYEDPEAWKEWNRNQIIAEETEKQSQIMEQRINESREKMLESKSDFLQKENAFLVAVQQDPNLTQQMLSSLDPAKFAYEKGEEFIKSLVDPTEIKDVKPKSPVSLANVSAKGANTVEVEEEESFDEMFADQKY